MAPENGVKNDKDRPGPTPAVASAPRAEQPIPGVGVERRLRRDRSTGDAEVVGAGDLHHVTAHVDEDVLGVEAQAAGGVIPRRDSGRDHRCHKPQQWPDRRRIDDPWQRPHRRQRQHCRRVPPPAQACCRRPQTCIARPGTAGERAGLSIGYIGPSNRHQVVQAPFSRSAAPSGAHLGSDVVARKLDGSRWRGSEDGASSDLRSGGRPWVRRGQAT